MRTKGYKNALTLISFLLPGTVLYSFLVIYQVVQGFELSLYRWKTITTNFFVGFDNYTWLFAEPQFYESLAITLLYMVVTTVASVVIGFTLGYFIYLGVRAKGFFKTVYFIPTVLSAVAVGYLWRYMYMPGIGFLGGIMQMLGYEDNVGILAMPETAIWGVLLVLVWSGVGIQILMFNAGFNNISNDVLEYATIDGCTGWRMVWHMMIPLSWDVVKMIIILQVIGSLRAFDLVFVMTNGGPNHATEILPMYMYLTAFERYKFGEGNTIAVMIFILSMGLTMLLRKILGKKMSD